MLQTTSPSSLLLSSVKNLLKTGLIKKFIKISKRILEAKSIYKKLINRMFHSLKPRSFKIILNTSKAGLMVLQLTIFLRNGLIAELPEMTTLTFWLDLRTKKILLIY